MKENKKETSLRKCSLCGEVIIGIPEYVKTNRGTKLYFHRSCVREGKRNGKK